MFPFKMDRASTQPTNPETSFSGPKTPARNQRTYPRKSSRTPIFNLDPRVQILEAQRKKDSFPYSFSYK